jgi:hypothetical protein
MTTDGRANPKLVFAYAATVLGVPSAVAASDWHAVAAHPLLATGLLIPLAIGLAVAGILLQMWRTTYNARVVAWLSGHIDQRTTRYWREYR